MSSISSDRLIERRKQMVEALSQLASQVNEVQQQLSTLNENYQVNRGALLQLNDLLSELGVDVDSLDSNTEQANTVDTDPVGDDVVVQELPSDIEGTADPQNL